ncbi:MAG UNVERIFIED_CONTAM: DegT/DnrJ/EryC1/StrS family aminotransferase [Planctomycetaceae bacterium]
MTRILLPDSADLRVHGDLGGYNHVEVGFNSRLDALQAAVLRVKLRHLDSWTAGRNRNAERYQKMSQIPDSPTSCSFLPPCRIADTSSINSPPGSQADAALR